MDNGKGRENNDCSSEENPFLEHAFEVESVGDIKAEKGDDASSSGRHIVRIISLRVRICDPDNLVGGCKHLIDALRLARVIPEDDPKAIILKVGQKKVSTYPKEKTWVEVTR